jgi:ribonuclease R
MAGTSSLRRDAIVDLLHEHGRPMHVGELGARLGLQPHERHALGELLEELAFSGVVVPLSGARYRLAARAAEDRDRVLEGIFHANPRGFGFVGGTASEEDLFVPENAIGGAMHGDRVQARVVSRSRRGTEAVVTEVLARAIVRVVGTLRIGRSSAWLEPDDTRIRGPVVLPAAARRDAGPALRDGLAAVVRLTRYPTVAGETPEAELVAVLGLPGEPDVEVAKILVGHGIDEPHSAEVLAETRRLAPELSAEDMAEREDLTDLPLVTIDPEDARDHDDAVWAERLEQLDQLEQGYRVWVAIADVAHYVRPGTALDAAALDRGNSLYLPDRAIPMLPPALSSGLCSLLPGQERLCLAVEIELAPTGAVRSRRVVEGVMRSRAKLSYGAVARALGFTLQSEREPEAEALRDGLGLMWEIAVLLRQRRLRRGALDFDLPDVHVVVDPDSRLPVAVEQRGGDPGVRKAYRLIEELMLLANEACAELLIERAIPTIFRVHAPPDPEKLDRFANLLAQLDLDLGPDPLEVVAADPKRLSRFLRRIAGHPRKSVLHALLLRAMQQAGYDTVNIGHFGLASRAYLHFSSPIRRYPDLVVHRVLRAMLRGAATEPVILPPGLEPSPGRGESRAAGRSESRSPGEASPLRTAALIASERERRGMEVERQVVDLYRALYMREHVGEAFEGQVSAITSSGVFVQLSDPFLDVLVSMDALGGDSWEMDDSGLCAVGARSGGRVTLGDPMVVLIEDVSITRRTVYGRRVQPETERPRGERRPARAKERRPAGVRERRTTGTRQPHTPRRRR